MFVLIEMPLSDEGEGNEGESDRERGMIERMIEKRGKRRSHPVDKNATLRSSIIEPPCPI